MSKRVLKIQSMLAGLLLAAGLTGCAENSTEYTQKGMEALARQEYGVAHENFSHAALADEDGAVISRGQGLAYMGERQYARAIGAFNMALEQTSLIPSSMAYDINYYMAICYYKLGQYDAAIACYDAIIALSPRETRAYFLRGNMHLYLNDVDSAMKEFDKAVNVGKKDCSLCLDIYDAMRHHGYAEQGQKYMDLVLSADSRNITDYDKARICFYREEYAQACNYLERERSGGKATEEVIRLLGECYKRQGQYDYAALVYQGYVEEYNDAGICNQMGMCYVEQGDYEKALEAFRKGIAIKENNTCMQTLKHNEIACLEHMTQFSEAALLLEEYIQTYGSTEELEKEYAFASSR